MADLSAIRRKFDLLPKLVKDEATAQLVKEVKKIVAQMDALKPHPKIKIGYTWGDAPEGSLSFSQAGNTKYGTIKVTIYAIGPDDLKALARWFEFGTSERFQKSGKATGTFLARPYFYPIWRANRTGLKSALSRSVTRAVKKINQS